MDARTPAKTLNKSDFIRRLPATLSVADVIAKGKAEGVKFGSSLVYMVRRRPPGKPKKGASKTKAAKPIAASVTSASSTPSTSATPKTPAKPPKSKADFVRANPDLSMKDLVGKALFDGIDLTENYVYKVRGQDKAVRRAKRAAAKVTTSTPAAVNGTGGAVAAQTASSSAEDLLRAVAAELGLGRAVEILAGNGRGCGRSSGDEPAFGAA